MPEGADKDAARAALPSETLDECAGDAKQHFTMVNKLIADTLGRGEHVMIHCHASISRSAAFILAYVQAPALAPAPAARGSGSAAVVAV